MKAVVTSTSGPEIFTNTYQPAATGPVWVQEQRLQHLADATWRKSLDLATLTILLRQQAELAAALERTAGWNGRTDGAS